MLLPGIGVSAFMNLKFEFLSRPAKRVGVGAASHTEIDESAEKSCYAFAMLQSGRIAPETFSNAPAASSATNSRL